MMNLNPKLLSSTEFYDALFSSPINNTRSRGVYSPMQFVLRLRADIHIELRNLDGIQMPSFLSINQIQAFSTYFHETIHWWQHVGSNFGLISSLKFPAQAHIIHSELKTVIDKYGAFKSIKQYDKKCNDHNVHINKILNYWHDIEFAGQIAFDPSLINKIVQDPYFDSWGHSYSHMWAANLWLLGSTIDPDFSFLPDIKKWEKEFQYLREKRIESHYWGSNNIVSPIGTKAIFEGQARFSQLQFLYKATGGKFDLNAFESAGLLNGIYVEAFKLFLSILNEQVPVNADHPLIGLFLLLCDIAINPTDGFPFDISHYESFIISNDPGYRFCILCQLIRNKHPHLKHAIKEFSQEEYVSISEELARAMGCFSPYESAVYIYNWMHTEKSIIALLEEESTYKYSTTNLPVRLFFSKFLNFRKTNLNILSFFVGREYILLKTIEVLLHFHKHINYLKNIKPYLLMM